MTMYISYNTTSVGPDTLPYISCNDIHVHVKYSRQMINDLFFCGGGGGVTVNINRVQPIRMSIFQIICIKARFRGFEFPILLHVNRKCNSDKSCATRHDCFKLAGVFLF